MGKTLTFVAILVVAVLLITLLATTLYYNNIVSDRDSKISALESQIDNLKNELASQSGQANVRANVITGLGISDVPPDPASKDSTARQYSHLWITGWVYNNGLAMAKGVGLIILAYDSSNKVILNQTMPVMNSATVYSTAIIHNSMKLPVLHTNIFSQQNMTVIMGIYHEGVFPSSTRYEAIPIYNSALPP
jgi:hypothetical protein